MDGQSRLAEICQSYMNIHKMSLSHIVATDYNTMITLVQQIKEEEALLAFNFIKESCTFLCYKDISSVDMVSLLVLIRLWCNNSFSHFIKFGIWNAVALEKAWGKNFGAAKLPSYTCAGKQVQMASFSGYLYGYGAIIPSVILSSFS